MSAAVDLLHLPMGRPALDGAGWRPRAAVVGGVVLAHLAAGGALLQSEAVRAPVAAALPMRVSLLTETPPPAPPPPPAPRPPPPPEPARLKAPPPPKPVIAAAPRPEPQPEPPAFTAPSAPPEPPPPEPVSLEAPPAPPAPPAPAPAPAAPKLISATDIVCPAAAAAAYPPVSEQLGEQGTALVRVLIDAQGRPQDAALHRSSGHPRLDRAALAAVRSLRCRPYTEAGVAQAVWVLAPIDFQLP